ncbi:Zn(II)2Cys6 transcription factor domain-containing protein [Aspergillus alliaceus]|uniref:Zn(II)2Cys6 transcription factor domain-containing protein n=1 Tax=Petromyces alliaceus TaxID=209559 RepID=UPI0012A3F8DD|nr:uncharacterized protein BDW43DRAFT_57757 [Aspergillus alliaceus]KAB8234588.1 hypothetical protein BDW43DRAFT_57757 [Aspergillus alliaceus]
MEVPKARGTGRSGPRRRTGCLTCRARKVRCDEAKPTCANCTRLRLQCIYKNIVPGIAPRRAPQRIPQPAFTADPIGAHIQDRPDVNYFDTVLQPRELRPQRASQISQQQVTEHALPSASNPVADFPGFDMLGFIGEITSDFEQKHLDLTNGGSQFPPASEESSPTLPRFVGTVNHTERHPTWTVEASVDTLPIPSDDLSDEVEQVDGILWPETRESYEEQLLARFADIDPPPTPFGSINLEWDHVRSIIVSNSRDTSCLLNALYCYSDIHKAMIEGKRWKIALMYHQQASSEILSCLLEDVDDMLLKRVLTAVFLLMVSEVCMYSPSGQRTELNMYS